MSPEIKSKFLSLNREGWFYSYYGWIYANKPTHIIDRIYNKQLILEKGLVGPHYKKRS